MSSHRLTVAAAIATIMAAISLYPLFVGITWFWAGVGAAIVVAGVGTLTRLRRLPVVVCLAAGILGLVLYLNLAFEAGWSYGHLLPTLSSLRHLGGLVRTGLNESAKYAPPAPQMSGLLLLASGGIGIVALLTDLIAVRMRSVALAGIPLLLLVTEPFTVSASRSWVGTLIAFCLGTSGYLGMLAAESRQRIRDWEPPRPGTSGGPDTSALSAAGRRVGLTSVVLALCLPLFIPGLHDTRLLGGQPGIGGRGGAGGSGAPGFPSAQAALSQELQSGTPQPVLSYRHTLSSGSATPQYLQLYALDELTDTAAFQLSDAPAQALTATGELPVPPGLTGISPAGPTGPATPYGPVVATTVHISPSIQQATATVDGKTVWVLPVPYPAFKVVPSAGTWQATRTGLMVYSDNTQVAGLDYSLQSLDEQPAESALEAAGPPPADIARDYESLPASYRQEPGLKAFATGITAGYNDSFEKALALQKWFDGGGFSYTLKAPSIGTAAQLATFIEATKKGYCQQFAVAMAVLARFLGIPSRVAIGFTSGKRQLDGSYLVTTHDAHEWPELYFSGFGWLRFEPTPTGPAGQGSATTPSYSTLRPLSVGGAAPPTLPTAGPSARASGRALAPGNVFGEVPTGGQSTIHKRSGVTPWEIFGLVVAGLLVVGLVAPALARLAIRRRRWGRATRGGDTDLAHAAWRELQDDLIDYQAGYSPSESPRAIGTRLRTHMQADLSPDLAVTAGPRPEAAHAWEPGLPDDVLADSRDGARRHHGQAGLAALERITMAEERARYSARPVSGNTLRRDSAEFRRALAATMPRRARWRARVLPLSVLSPTADGVSQAADALGSFRLRRPRLRGRA